MIADATTPRILEDADRLEIVIPSEAQLKPVLFLAAWVLIWPLGLLVAPLSVAALIPIQLLAWSAALVIGVLWIASWASAVAKLAYWIFGSERITVDQSALALSHGIGSLARSRRFERARIRRLRVSPRRHFVKDWYYPLHLALPRGGGLSFTYGKKVVRFGRNITQKQAASLAQRIGHCLVKGEAA